MLGLPKDLDERVVQAIKGQGETQRKTFRRHSARSVLVPTMVGSMMILVPRREDSGQMDWQETIPPIGS